METHKKDKERKERCKAKWKLIKAEEEERKKRLQKQNNPNTKEQPS